MFIESKVQLINIKKTEFQIKTKDFQGYFCLHISQNCFKLLQWLCDKKIHKH